MILSQDWIQETQQLKLQVIEKDMLIKELQMKVHKKEVRASTLNEGIIMSLFKQEDIKKYLEEISDKDSQICILKEHDLKEYEKTNKQLLTKVTQLKLSKVENCHQCMLTNHAIII